MSAPGEGPKVRAGLKTLCSLGPDWGVRGSLYALQHSTQVILLMSSVPGVVTYGFWKFRHFVHHLKNNREVFA